MEVGTILISGEALARSAVDPVPGISNPAVTYIQLNPMPNIMKQKITEQIQLDACIGLLGKCVMHEAVVGSPMTGGECLGTLSNAIIYACKQPPLQEALGFLFLEAVTESCERHLITPQADVSCIEAVTDPKHNKKLSIPIKIISNKLSHRGDRVSLSYYAIDPVKGNATKLGEKQNLSPGPSATISNGTSVVTRDQIPKLSSDTITTTVQGEEGESADEMNVMSLSEGVIKASDTLVSIHKQLEEMTRQTLRTHRKLKRLAKHISSNLLFQDISGSCQDQFDVNDKHLKKGTSNSYSRYYQVEGSSDAVLNPTGSQLLSEQVEGTSDGALNPTSSQLLPTMDQKTTRKRKGGMKWTEERRKKHSEIMRLWWGQRK